MRSLPMLFALYGGLSACGLRNIDDLNAGCPAGTTHVNCQRETLYEAEPPVAGELNEAIYAITADDKSVYFSSYGPDGNQLKATTQNEPHLVTSYPTEAARDIAVNDDDIFYSAIPYAEPPMEPSPPGVYAVNGPAPVVALAPGTACNGMVAAKSYFYIASNTGLWRRSLDDVGDALIAVPDPARPGAAIENSVAVGVVDADMIVFTTIDGACTSLGGTSGVAQGSVYSWDGGGVSMLDTGPGCRFAIAADDRDVFWVDLDAGTLMKTALDAEEGQAVVVSDAHDKPISVALDEHHVYWLNLGEQMGSTGELRRWDRQTGKEELLFGELPAPADIVLEGDYIYWTMAGTNANAPAAVQRRHK